MSAARAAKCWSCSADIIVGAATCSSCNAILPPGKATPFERLGIETLFAVDDKTLERAWLTRSRAVHPDRLAKKSPADRRYGAEQTAALNDAYRAIKDPFDRAVWLVKSAGVDVATLDQALLVELMEAREAAEQSADGRARVISVSSARFDDLQAGLAAQLKDLADKPQVERAGRALAEMKTLARLVDDLGGPKLIATLGER